MENDNMTIKELIRDLQRYPEDATVLIRDWEEGTYFGVDAVLQDSETGSIYIEIGFET